MIDVFKWKDGIIQNPIRKMSKNDIFAHVVSRHMRKQWPSCKHEPLSSRMALNNYKWLKK